jgi:phenylacetate-CoA ligase
MNRSLLSLYHSLPAPLQAVAATARGAYLYSWRYDGQTDARVQEALSRETWSPKQWTRFREERLGHLLHRAATKVPYYREQWQTRRRNGDRASWDLLENWPVLEKEVLRNHPEAFVSDDSDPRRMLLEQTSGTTGTPLRLWFPRDTQKAWYALFEARWRGWEGLSRHDRWAILGGQLVTPISRRRPPFWVWNGTFRQLYMSVYHLAPDLVPSYVDALARYRIRYVLGYTSALYALAQEALRSGLEPPKLAAVLTNAEPVLQHERETISRAFGCPVRETYGMSEMVVAASECDFERLHLWPDVGQVEILEHDRTVAPGTVGDVVSTGLLNAAMPLVRYRTGDRAAIDPDSSPCGCGRTLPRLLTIEGRADDVIYTRDGRAVGRLDPIFKSGLPIREAQIVQESLSGLRLRYVPAPETPDVDLSTLVQALRDRLGDVQITLEPVAQIPRSSNGKFRSVISKLPREHRPESVYDDTSTNRQVTHA